MEVDWTQSNDTLFEIELRLVIDEPTEKLGVSVEAAQALAEASLIIVHYKA